MPIKRFRNRGLPHPAQCATRFISGRRYPNVKGGTPFNEAYKYGLEHPESTAVISGVNLPILLELGTTPLSKQPLAAVAQLALNPGSDGIAQANLAATGDDDDLDF